MKTTFLLRVICLSTCMFLLLLKARAQDSHLTPASERIKAGFTQQGYEPQLITAWAKDNEIVWEPQWDALFSVQVEGKKNRLVPLLPILQSRDTHKPLAFKLVGARRYLAIAGEGDSAIYQFLTLIYDDKKNQVQADNSKFLATFNGTSLRQTIGKIYVAVNTYANGQRQTVVNKPGLPNTTSTPLGKTTGVICDFEYTCYWSAYCSFDNTTYGTITTSTSFCVNPFTPAGACFSPRWTLTQSESRYDCHFDNANFNPDWIGPVPRNRPCPGDPLVVMNIAASSPGTPGNIRGGTFGSDVRTVKGKKSGHEGTDIEATPGTPVYTGVAGEVIEIKSSFAPGEYKAHSYGNYVYVHNVDGTYSKYNHLDGIGAGLVVGSKLNRGVQIGISGSTGNAAHVIHKHLHIQMFDSSRKPIDPQPHLGTPMNMRTGKGIRPC